MNRSSLLTEGMKSPKDTLFFLTPESEVEKLPKSERYPPVLPRSNGSPPKKTAGGKVLRNQTRRAVQDEVHTTAAAKLVEHQRELHEKLQTEGLQKYSEGGGGTGGKEGKGWKKFQSYKGEAALPPEIDRLRVRFTDTCQQYRFIPQSSAERYTLIARRRRSSCPCTGLLFPSISIPLKMLARTTKASSLFSVSISKHQVN